MKTIEGVELELGKCTLMPIIYKDYSHKEIDELATTGALQPNLGCHPCGVTEDILAKAWTMQHSPRMHLPSLFTVISDKKLLAYHKKIIQIIKPANYSD